MKRIKKSIALTCLLLLVVLFQIDTLYAADKTTVTFWHAMGGWRTQVIERMAADFNLQHPGVEVKPELKGGYDETFIAAMAAAKSGKAPHIVHVVQYATQEAIDSGVFAVAEELIDQFGIQIKWEDYIDQVLQAYQVNNKLYSFPWNSSTSVLFYNKTIFDKAGLTIPYKPTFSDIVNIGRKIVKNGHASYAITWPLHYWFVEQWMAEAGQNMVDNNNGWGGKPTKAYLTSEPVTGIHEWWKQLYDERLWVNPGRVAWGEAVRLFVSGEAAMFISSTSHVTYLEKQGVEKGFEVGTTFIPIIDNSERNGCSIGGGTLWITKNHSKEELKAATEFVVWMSETAQTIRWHQNTGYFPVKKTAIEALRKEGWFHRHPNYQTAFSQLLESKSLPANKGPVFGAFRNVIEIMENGAESIMGGESVKKTLDDMNAKATQAIADYERMQ